MLRETVGLKNLEKITRNLVSGVQHYYSCREESCRFGKFASHHKPFSWDFKSSIGCFWSSTASTKLVMLFYSLTYQVLIFFPEFALVFVLPVNWLFQNQLWTTYRCWVATYTWSYWLSCLFLICLWESGRKDESIRFPELPVGLELLPRDSSDSNSSSYSFIYWAS